MSIAAEPRPQVPLASLTPAAEVTSVYLLTSLERRVKKNGDPFFMMQFSDATGVLNGVIWDRTDALENGGIKCEDFVQVSGVVAEFNNSLQITVRKITRVEDTEVDLSVFLPVSPRPRAEMEAELDAWIAQVEDRDCRKLLDMLFQHKELRERYCTAPAAVRIHQPYIHGLLEHTLNVMKLAANMASMYEPIDRNLLITGTLIHDIGKIRELEWKRTLTYTTEGRLLGHISMGAAMISDLINVIRRRDGFDPRKRDLIIHMILSHHGKLEWGSPVTPKTREALVLHYADHAEAYMSAFSQEVQKHIDRGDSWTSYSKLFDAYLYVGGSESCNLPSSGEEAPGWSGIEQKSGPIEDVRPAK